MKKIYLIILSAFSILSTIHAQTRTFREVNKGISTELKSIIQDGALVGYLAFTELEQADKDSFSYRITIMDENLNDIGIVNFKQLKLSLLTVSFEQDVLCLAYLKSNVLGYRFQHRVDKNLALENGKLWLFNQFISLKGEVVNSFERNLTANIVHYYTPGVIPSRVLKEALQLENLNGKGFACFYGDAKQNNLLIFNTKGELTWETKVEEDPNITYMLASSHNVYLLMRKRDDESIVHGNYLVLGYNTDSNTVYPKYWLKDKKGNILQPLSFENDPVTGTPYISGTIVNSKPMNANSPIQALVKGDYAGVFCIGWKDLEEQNIKEEFSYWNDGSKPGISIKGHFADAEGYIIPDLSFRDFYGNTYFLGGGVKKKYKSGKLQIMKMDIDGKLNYESDIPVDFELPWSDYNVQWGRNSYKVALPESKSMYVISMDKENTVIYNVNKRKVIRTIPVVNENKSIHIYPAKEGHVIVSEYDSEEKYTKLSIEAI